MVKNKQHPIFLMSFYVDLNYRGHMDFTCILECNLSVSMFSTKIVTFITMVLLVTKVVLSEHICFMRLKQIQNIKVVIFQSVSIMPFRNHEDSFETPPHTPDQALCLLLTYALVIAGPT